MLFNLRDDDLILADANVYVACVIPSTGYNKTGELNISDCNVNLQPQLPRKWDTFATFANWPYVPKSTNTSIVIRYLNKSRNIQHPRLF